MLLDVPLCGCLVVVIACFSLLARAEDRCPKYINIKPCRCTFDGYFHFPMTKCEAITDLDVLQDVLDRSDEPFPFFILSRSTLTFLPSRALNQKYMKQMYVTDTTLMTFFDQEPEENHKIQLIKLIYCNVLRGFIWEEFKPLKDLRNLEFIGTPVNEVGKAFEQSISPTLEYLILDNTDTKISSPTVFRNLVNLRYIEIQYARRLSTMKRSMFPDVSRLEVLNFSHDHIRSLPDDMFSNMPNLQKVRLTANRLKTFPESVFSSIMDTARQIIVLANPISCDCSVKWVVYKEYKGNLRGECSKPISRKGMEFKDLRRKDFSYCTNSVQTLLETTITDSSLTNTTVQ